MRSKIFMSSIIFLVFLFSIQSSFAQDTQTLEYDGLERTYNVNLPDNYDPATASPLLIALHGYGDTGQGFEDSTQIDEIARSSGYIAVFPDGYKNGWNYLDENEMAQGEDYTDDVGFLKALIDKLIQDYNVDTKRIYIVGFSNGALLALRMGCELSDRLAGVAAIAGTYSFELVNHCLGTAPIPTVIVWGTSDEVFLINGFVWVTPDGKIRSSLSLNQTRSYLLTRYLCDKNVSPTQVQTENSKYRIQREIYNCGAGVPALLYLVVDAKHGWPDGSEITLLDGKTAAPIEMTFFEIFDNVHRTN